MTNATKKALRADLKAVLAKYNVAIAFTCSDSSDTHGLYNARLVIQDATTEAIVHDTDNDWQIRAIDLK
ncbi:hypothetical protein [Hymenobacter defluvii]|uniref:Uncharacterized protein n=1 Tax=Hymenobacter defluvii TaxID=2054411 RepID=A0ABS3THH2_9BACT|nr:hypothetical protein [Hymenobacter defluvii]MBO3273101.1 hypothetical protein [Hymenobacter defluvii]